MSSRDCNQELCPMWDGESCPCETFNLDPDDLPRNFTGYYRIDKPHKTW